ncbi:MAG: AEC family transporter, partial [Firmicutes bacterium]|nr:AEC family transporter [Bacillota bacterium]
MLEILTKAGCYITIILLGIALRAAGFFKEEDFKVLSKIVVKITLPAAIISSAAGREIAPDLLSIAAIGFGGGVLYMLIGYFLGRKGGKEQKAFCLLNLPGYNVGNFALPFTQSF